MAYICDSDTVFDSLTIDSVLWPTPLAAWQAIAQDFLKSFGEYLPGFLLQNPDMDEEEAWQLACDFAEELRTYTKADSVLSPSGAWFFVHEATAEELDSGEYLTPEQGRGFGWDYCGG